MAILEGWNNETVLHENRSYFPGERKCIVFALQHGGNDVTWKCSIKSRIKYLDKEDLCVELSEITNFGVQEIHPFDVETGERNPNEVNSYQIQDVYEDDDTKEVLTKIYDKCSKM